MEKYHKKIIIDSSPLGLFADFLESLTMRSDSLVNSGEFTEKRICTSSVESRCDTTGASILTVTVYPSKALMDFVSTTFALDRDF